MQQALVGLHQRRLRKPASRRLIAQDIAQRHQRHALVMRHVVFNHGKGFRMTLAGGREIHCVHEAIFAAAAKAFQVAQIGNGIAWCQHGGHDRRVGCHNVLASRRAAQGQPWHAKGRILIGQRVILRKVG